MKMNVLKYSSQVFQTDNPFLLDSSFLSYDKMMHRVLEGMAHLDGHCSHCKYILINKGEGNTTTNI